jgi:uroporphyrinogen III methyltransferase/synthase
MNGKVYLVGAGPGDIDLMTLRGKELISQADVLIYDFLAPKELLSWTKPGCELIDAGKSGKKHTLTQDQINAAMLKHADAGQTVVRLKGGDPFVFGRGGEECEFLTKVNISYEVVPGITSAVAVPAYAGIPLTHRELSSSFAVVTGHYKDDQSNAEVQVPVADTLVYLMGVDNIENIVKALTSKGWSKDSLTAVIQWGTTNIQKTITATLETVAEKIKIKNITSPAVIVVGPVVALREKILWFESRPLLGQKIIITRTQAQASKLRKKLEILGAVVIEYPTIEIKPLIYESAVTTAIQSLKKYHWVIFTSANSVALFFEKLKDLGDDVRALAGIKIGAIGPVTRSEIEKFNLRVDYSPSEFVAEKFVEEFPEVIKGLSILLPRAKVAREIIPETMTKLGARVQILPLYETVRPEKPVEDIHDANWITFTSSSTVENFLEMEKLPKNIKIASIGPVTTDALKAHGVTPTAEAKPYNLDGLVQAMIES